MKRIFMFAVTIGIILICRAGKSDAAFVNTGDLASSILRFHILANSDSEEDQKLKLLIKDKISKKAAEDMKQAEVSNKDDAVEYMKNHMNTYIKEAKNVAAEYGYAYDVTADIGKSWFPIKIYGRYIFPEGEYDAVQMKIGNGAGRNWWCIMFPSLCIVDEAYQVVPDENDTEEKEEEAYKIKFRIVEWIKDMW